MAKIKSVSAISEKWSRVTPQRAGDYETGVQSPRTPWAQATQQASKNYTQAVTEAASQGRFAKGVAKAGDAKWQQKALQKGPARFSEGVATSGPDYEAGFSPYARVIEATQLPPRAPAGSPQNIQRVAALAAALSQAKRGK